MIGRKDLESPLIFILFLKRKQNKKENLSETLYLEKTFVKNQTWVQESGYLLGKYDKDRSTPLSP